MNLYKWAERWSIPLQAIAELRATLGIDIPSGTAVSGIASEAQAMNSVRLQAARNGVYLWRNNVGACRDESGRMIRYGLANESERMNKVVKSSDLVGFRPVMIGPEHIGKPVAIFCARECKEPGWQYTGTERERAQLAFITLIATNGGDAKFTTGEL